MAQVETSTRNSVIDTLVLNLRPNGGALPVQDVHHRVMGETDRDWEYIRGLELEVKARISSSGNRDMDGQPVPGAHLCMQDSPLILAVCRAHRMEASFTEGAFSEWLAAFRQDYRHVKRTTKRPWPVFIACFTLGSNMHGVDADIIHDITGQIVAVAQTAQGDAIDGLVVPEAAYDLPLSATVISARGEDAVLGDIVRESASGDRASGSTAKTRAQARARALACCPRGSVSVLNQRISAREAELADFVKKQRAAP